MTSPTYEELQARIAEWMGTSSWRGLPTPGFFVPMHEIEAFVDTIRELQAENTRLTEVLTEEMQRSNVVAGQLNRLWGRFNESQEQVRQYAEAITEREKAIEEGNDPVVEHYDLMFALIATNPPDGASALSELEALKQTIETQASMMDGLREGSRTHAQGEREALSEVAKLRGTLTQIMGTCDGLCCILSSFGESKCWPKIARAALGERSTSPDPRVPVSLDKCICGRVYAEHVIYTGTDDIFCPAQFIGTMDKFRISEGEGL